MNSLSLKSLAKLLLFSAIISLLTSCGGRHFGNYFVPQDGILAGVNEKNDLIVSGSYGNYSKNSNLTDAENQSYGFLQLDSEYQAFQGSVAWSPVKHLGLSGSIQHFGQHTENKQALSDHGYNLSFGAGGYYPWEINKHINLLFDSYTSFGIGRNTNVFYTNGAQEIGSSRHLNRQITNQTAVHLKINGKKDILKNVYSVSLGFRATHNNIKEMSIENTEQIPAASHDQFRLINKTPNRLFLYGMTRHEFGFKHLRLYVSHTNMLNPRKEGYKISGNLVQCGVSFDIGALFKK